MKILAVADAEDRALADHFDPQRWSDVDLIVSCGDLEGDYLEYLVSRLNVPCFYVRGNHDQRYAGHPPGGCEDLNGRVVRFRGCRLAGLEGSRWYGGRGVEYSDRSIAFRAQRLRLRILLARGIDVLVTHAPPEFEPGDAPADAPPELPPDRVHQGFGSFRKLILAWQPRLALHGHTHLGYGRGLRERRIGRTRVIDCYGSQLIELEPGATAS